MKYRNEWKHEINYSDMVVLRQRLKEIMLPDLNAHEGKYLVRSLYFDDLYDKALREKINGIKEREKFRIRYYNLNPDFIKLEKKSKFNNLSQKQIAKISEDEVKNIFNQDYRWMKTHESQVVREFFLKLTNNLLRPKAVIDYMREPFIYKSGNVRVTLDYDLRTAMNPNDFLNKEAVTVPIPGPAAILEVKWDEYLPDIIKRMVGLKGRQAFSFSKYASSRIYNY